MKAEKSSQKRKRGAAQFLPPVMALLIVALVAVAMLYLRAAEPTVSPSPDKASGTGGVSAPAESGAPVPEPTPYEPLALHLDLNTSIEALDAVVCDSEGLAVPGYAFPLEIRYQDGSTHQVQSDINGHYYAEYIPAGEYTVTLLPFEGFIASDSASCRVEQKLDYVAIENVGRFVEVDEVSSLPSDKAQNGTASGTVTEIEGLAEALPPDGGEGYHYRYSVGENGYLLRADGTESDVIPVEDRGDLAYGVREVTVYHLLDGTPLEEKDIPADAVLWTDYYMDRKPVAVPLILGGGAVDESYAVTAEKIDPSSEKLSGWVEKDGRSYYYAADGRPLSGLKNVDGRLYFFDGTGAKASSLGIDVSYFNSAIDWNAVKNCGIDFAIIRVAGRTWEKGILFEDEDSYRQGKNGGYYLQGAKAAGLKVGVYVYSNAINTNEAVEEASLALDVIRKSGVELDMPIYFDLEYSGEYPKGRADKLSFSQRAEIVEAFCTTVENSGYRAGVYASEYFFSRALRLEDVADYDVWYAVYTTGFALPSYRGFDIWQFSESVRINGMPDYTDMNVIF